MKNFLFFTAIFVFLGYKCFILKIDDENGDTLKRRRPIALMKDVKIGGKVHPSSLKLEAQMKPLQKMMFEQKVPVFHDLVIVNGTYFAIFNSDGSAGEANKLRYIVSFSFCFVLFCFILLPYFKSCKLIFALDIDHRSFQKNMNGGVTIHQVVSSTVIPGFTQ